MRGRLIVVTGTGTGIGKTHIATALLRRAATSAKVFGYKPIESGVDETVATDASRLEEASSFHVQHAPKVQLRAGLSPHLAARREGASLDWRGVVEFVDGLRSSGAHVLIELPGGLFTPLAPAFRNVEAVRSLVADVTLMLAPDRLGVLHDVGAALAGAAHLGATVSAIGLVMPEVTDASSGSNATELASFTHVPVVGTWPWASVDVLEDDIATKRVVREWLGLDSS